MKIRVDWYQLIIEIIRIVVAALSGYGGSMLF